MSLTEELVKPAADKFSRYQWVLAGLVAGIFLAFVDTLFIATVLGHLGVQLGKWFGVPTTFMGYFFTGMLAGRFAPPDIVWEPPAGVLICVLLMMLHQVGLRGHGALFLVYFVLVPAIAVAVCYVGLRFARRNKNKSTAPAVMNNPAG
jgi:hypothetical protein